MNLYSDLKKFFLIWSGIFLIVGLMPAFNNGNIRLWAIFISIVFILIAFLKPQIIEPFYKIWIKIGDFISGIVSKIILFTLFYFIFTPISFILKILGKDLLNKKIDKNAKSYWIDRNSQPESMKNQF